jgi:hypothetical protein
VGGEMVLVFSPEHAKTISEDGLSRADVKRYIHENTGRHRPEDLIMLVAGGPAGRWTMAITGWGSTSRSVTVPIR